MGSGMPHALRQLGASVGLLCADVRSLYLWVTKSRSAREVVDGWLNRGRLYGYAFIRSYGFARLRRSASDPSASGSGEPRPAAPTAGAQTHGPDACLCNSDRLFWAVLSTMWSRWTKVLVIVQPQTVVRWHQAGFRLFWHWKSRRRTGRSPTDRDLIELIRRMWQANPTWGSPRIRAELAKLGLQVSAATVRKYRPKGDRRPPSQTWRAFLRNHASQLIAVDFFTVPTVTFRVLFVFVVLAHERRRVLHFAVTEAPSASWAAQQVVNGQRQ